MPSTVYIYGMRLRGFSPGCQPMNGLIAWEEDKSMVYHCRLIYGRKLTEAELRDYELDFIEKKFFNADMILGRADV